MPVTRDATNAQLSVSESAGRLRFHFSGDWRVTENPPHWRAPKLPQPAPREVEVCVAGLGSWDSSLLLALQGLRHWCEQHKLTLDDSTLPANLRELGRQLHASAAKEGAAPAHESPSLFAYTGLQTQFLWRQGLEISHFVGECCLSANRLLRKPAAFRWRHCLGEMQQCGVMALPIVSLISFLVGVTLAYTAATILRLFGGDIWIADLIGLSVTREMAAVMTAVVLAGRTGAAFAAHLGNMKANEEIDALQTLGVAPTDFLVLPRIVALAVMTPLLTLYSVLLGILGGMVIALGILSIPPSAYWVEMLTIVDLSDVVTGLIKASCFGMIIGMAGCLRGLQADRSAEGVGRAATSAVVTSILLMVVADALFAVIFNILGW